jgi:hypothetical protein
MKAWISYNVLEGYKASESFLKEFLTTYAKENIGKGTNKIYYPENKMSIYQADIDPRIWFGCNEHELSFLSKEEEISQILVDVLFERIKELADEDASIPFVLGMFGRAEAELPFNWTFPLAKLFVDYGIFLDHNHTVDLPMDNNPRSHDLSKENLEKIILKYPTAWIKNV